MAITSTGYPLTIAPGGPWANAHGSAGRRYAAHTVDACKVTATPGGTRQVNIAVGPISGVGVRDFNDAVFTTTSVANPGVPTYYCVVARRRWNDDSGGNRTEFATVSAGTTRAIPTLQRTPGTIDEQPLALFRIDPGVTTPADIVDLRQCSTDSGVVTIFDDLALTDIRLGADVYNATTGVRYSRVGSSTAGLEQTVRFATGRIFGTYSGTWWDLPPSGTHGASVKVWSDSPQGIGSVSIPDPGVPYRVQGLVSAMFGSETENATRWDFDLIIGTTLLDALPVDTTNYVFNQQRRRFMTLPSSATFTGAQILLFRARRIYGSGYGAISTDNRGISATVYEA